MILIKRCKLSLNFAGFPYQKVNLKQNDQLSRLYSVAIRQTTQSLKKATHHCEMNHHNKLISFKRCFSDKRDDDQDGQEKKVSKKSEDGEEASDKKSDEDDEDESTKSRTKSKEGMKIYGYSVETPDLPLLMKFKPRVVPNLLYTIMNWFKIFFYINPMIDREFILHNFMEGAKQALEVISGHLADGNLKALQGLVTDEALREIKVSLETFTVKQREALRIHYDDIIFSFPYDIRIINIYNKHLIEIFVVFDCLRDMNRIVNENRGKSVSFEEFNDIFLNNKCFCNYIFVREYSKDFQGQWMVNKLLHIKDKDLMKSLPGPFFKKFKK